MAKPLGTKNKFNARVWLADQLAARDFRLADKFVSLYNEAPIDLKVKLFEIMIGYIQPKPRPVDDNGNSEETPHTMITILSTDDRLALVSKAKKTE